jgi:hypothetical protein
MSGVDRRAVIGWGALVAGVVGAGWGVSHLPSGAPSGRPLPPGYGKDPPLATPKRQLWPSVVDATVRRDLAALIDVVVPGIDGSPKGSALGLVDFFDEWLGAPYPDMVADRTLIMPMLKRMTGFAGLAVIDRKTQVDELASGGTAKAFARFCVLAAAAYHTTPAGITALGYVGNEPRPSFDGPPPEVLAHFDAELAKLEFKP